jgi:DNA helicase-2/ATP-dependent DNA helicase PcrA
MQADGTVAEGVELSASDLPVVTLGDYLENVSLLSAVDLEDDEETSNKIALMTVHSSKGLEFPYVYVTGMEENLFPSGGFMASESEIEEERRLFYVAMTRAKKAVQFSFASTRMRNGKTESNSPSRFVREVDPQYIANPLSTEIQEDGASDGNESGFRFGKRGWNNNSYGRSGAVRVEKKEVSPKPASPAVIRRPQPVVAKRVPDSEFEPTPILQLRAGQRIEHNRFGFGQIVEISGSAADMKAKISFDEHGEKILILKYAKIRVVQ